VCHYIPAGIDGKGDGAVCWDCKSPGEKERLKFNKEHRTRTRAERDRETYKRFHPTIKRVINGVWRTIQR
jgi:hypothetical protein